MATTEIEGTCACDSVKWTSTSQPKHMDFCYCTQCQRITGAPFGSWVGIPKDALTFTGPIATCKISDIATRTLCEKCGGTLTMQYYCCPKKTHVAAGTVVKGAELLPRVGCHLFVGKKPVWYDIPEDGVARWDEFDDEFVEILARWRAEGAKQ